MSREHPTGAALVELVEACLASDPDTPQAEDSWSQADRAFVALFAALDSPPVVPDFVARTVRAARRVPLASGRRGLVSRWHRRAQGWAAATALLAASAVASIVLVPLIGRVFPALVVLGVEAGLAVLQLMKGGFGLWVWSAEASRVLAVIAQTNAGASALALTALVGFVAVAGLERLMRSERESSPC
jgi:hypothetical protein